MIFLRNQGRREREVGSAAAAAFWQRCSESSARFCCTAGSYFKGESLAMSSIPMGAHAAFKVRDSQFFGPGGGTRQQQSSSFQQQVPTGENEMQSHPPVKYNGKLMNSIWGMYNRYSVHNIKSHIAYDKA